MQAIIYDLLELISPVAAFAIVGYVDFCVVSKQELVPHFAKALGEISKGGIGCEGMGSVRFQIPRFYIDNVQVFQGILILGMWEDDGSRLDLIECGRENHFLYAVALIPEIYLTCR